MSPFSPVVLVVDDETNILKAFQELLIDKYDVITTPTGRQALEEVKNRKVEVCLLDIKLDKDEPGMDGLRLLQEIKRIDDGIDVIMITALNTVKTAVRAMQLGAYDYIVKPFDINEVLISIEKAMERRRLLNQVSYLREEVERSFRFGDIIGKSREIRTIFEMVKALSKNDATVLITGDNGTGKELVARTIHFNGSRRDGPFVSVDCAAIPDTLLESELFGYERGAFTGATKRKIGKFELANKGTLFLDEIGSMKFDTQAKLLRVLQEHEIERLGGTRKIKIDIRVIAATNIDLKAAMRAGRFREDLYFRLNVVPIYIPPLRKRREDIPLLTRHFLKIYNERFNKKIKGFSHEAMEYLTRYSWPGNVRELQNIVERMVVLGKEDVITPDSLPLDILLGDEADQPSYKNGLSLRNGRMRFERSFILSCLDKTGWNITRASRLLGCHRNTLALRMKNLGIERPKTHKAKSR